MSAAQNQPVNPGETYRLQIKALGNEGDSVGYIEGVVIFVPEAELGDWVTVEIEAVHETFTRAAVVEESAGDVQFTG